jgi:hypothetical protein
MLYLFVFLKLPLLAACWLVWWAIRSQPEEAQEPESDGGTRYRRPHPPPRLPRPPRRGPHGDRAPLPPPRVRRVHARARQLER